MKKNLLGAFLTLALNATFAQAVDPDLPVAPKSKAGQSAIQKKIMSSKNPYLKTSNPPTVYYNVHSDINKIKWLSGSVQASYPLSQMECNKISDVYIEHCREKAKNETKPDLAAKYWKNLGEALIYRSKWDEAIKAYSCATNSYLRDQQNTAEVIYSIANCQLGAGRTNECIKTLEHLLALKLKTGGYAGNKRRHVHINGRARQALHWLKGKNLVALDLPRWTDCKAFPQAQKAQYSQSFVNCPVVSVRASGMSEADGRIRFLKKKLESKGIKVKSSGGYNLRITLSPSAKISKSEGYTLDVGKHFAAITARDKQGVLWGIVSFLQVCDYEKKCARICSIEDWPDCPKRGFLGRCCIDDCEFMIFNKMNINTAKPHFLWGGDYSPFNVYKTQMMAKEYNDLGLELYFGFMPLTMDVAWPLCWNVFLEMQLEHAMKWVSLGVGIYYPYDDARYWEQTYMPEDQATGKLPSDYDANHLVKFYSRIKAKYPSFKMQFCPPFYWGPRAGHPYPDDREKYLRSLRKLPPEVSVFWTGERVGSHKKKKSDCKWFSDLIGRKPSLFQNKAAPHYYLSYVLDEVPWDSWYYNGFVDFDMRSIQKNSDTPQDYPILSSLADYLWNVNDFDRTRAVKRGLEQYAGRGVYDILKPAYKYICRTDAYRYGAINSRVLHEDRKDWEKGLVVITNATEKVRAIAGERVMGGFGSWERAIVFYKNVLYGIKNPPDFKKMFAKPYELWATHLVDCGYDKQAGDIVIDPIDFAGGCILKADPAGKKNEILPNSTVTSSLIAKSKAKLKFSLDKDAAADMLLVLRVKSAVSNNLSAWLNGVNVRNKFGIDFKTIKMWRTLNVLLPKDLLKAGENEIVLHSLSENGYPISIEFAIIKKKFSEYVRKELLSEVPQFAN